MEEQRLRSMLTRTQQSAIILTYPTQLTPFCFPIKVDSMREDMSSEKLEDRLKKNAGTVGERLIQNAKVKSQKPSSHCEEVRRSNLLCHTELVEVLLGK